ncbi:NACHT, LRR and PYD domains-containing protein 3-like isoform X4 [Pygocentrus nattereri]|nr:NACHT, LRR and PYD domains-containing protein 3-like isoform X4 [Pygocentrus nattereri]XP_037399565.1 NACHT, LRR and PYD domains-containing protein 3-like isoform X4 [Pygocentrus nattereri]XP_037399566.1 NACHT, LRR and PYD domains-containing protein 3-like isoform X4 [Pygocentrus nattereri]
MSNIAEVLLNTLQNLLEKDLELFQWHLINGLDSLTCIPKCLLEKADRHDTVDQIVQRYGHNGAVEITLTILKKMNQNQVAEELMTELRKGRDRCEEIPGKRSAVSSTAVQTGDSDALATGEHLDTKMILKKQYKTNFINLYEGTSLEGDYVPLEDIYTELYVIEGCTGGVNTEHEVRQIEGFYPKIEEKPIKFSDIFKVQSNQNVLGTKVLTLGIAGVGKTASVHKFILDWAEDKCNQDLDFILFLPFRELNLIKDEMYTLTELLFYVHHDLQDSNIMEILNVNYSTVFILDGLDESKICLDFNQKKPSRVQEKTTVDKLITYLIKGELLPSALIWITSRPAAAKQIPRKYFRRVTEIRGFNDPQKEEYFRKRIKDHDKASRIISHIKTARSLHILCHIPVFCRISATVLQEMLKEGRNLKNAPRTLTEMYTRFLLFHTSQKNDKYSAMQNKNSTVSSSERLGIEGILKLGNLAFLQLEKGQLIFYEKDLKECDIDVDEAVVYSGVCTQIFKKDEKIFSFVHLSFQEFLAAVFVFLTFKDKGNPLLQTTLEKIKWKFTHKLGDLLKTAVKKAIKSENGHLDLFLRFLLGLSLCSNQRLLKSLQPEMDVKEESLEGTVDYIKRKIKKIGSSEKSINLFYCLSELKDNSLTSEIQEYLNSGDLSRQELSNTQWSTLVFVLLMSEESQEKFELKKYKPSDEGLWRLLRVVKNTRQALLDHCNLSKDGCETLASVLSSDSALRELDLSNNELQDSGVEKLSAGLKNSHCQLQILRLALCSLGKKTCEYLESVLKLENSLKELDLSHNDLQDMGVVLLSAGLKDSHCKLQILRLSGCMITEEGCSSLASALTSNPSHLNELDLTYNHPGESGVRLLSARLEDSHCALNTLRVEHGGKIRINPGPKKYSCELTLDPNTAHTHLSLCEQNRKVVCVREQQSYPDHPERFDEYQQVLCRERLTGLCYWEAEWSGWKAAIALTYKSIIRKGSNNDCDFGWNNKSWILYCFSDNTYSVCHNSDKTEILAPSSSSKRVGVYVDCPSGTLSFYSVSPGTHTLNHLHTFNTTFTEPLYVGFRLYDAGSSISVCV